MKFLLALFIISSAAHAQTLERHEFESAHMGTLFKVILYAPDETEAKKAADSAFELAEKLNASFSDYEADSELRQLIEKGHGKVSAELFEILTLAKEISKATDGAFDITTGAHTRNWRKAKITRKLPTAEEITAAKAASGWQHLRLEPESRTVTLLPKMQLDLGGIAKGYAADAMLALLKKQGFQNASVAAGGDVAAGFAPPGSKAWKVAIAPDGKTTKRHIPLVNEAVSTSGSAEQKIEIDGKVYSHVVNPKTGLGLRKHISVSVRAKRAALADAFATAFSVLGKEKSQAIAKANGVTIVE